MKISKLANGIKPSKGRQLFNLAAQYDDVIILRWEIRILFRLSVFDRLAVMLLWKEKRDILQMQG